MQTNYKRIVLSWPSTSAGGQQDRDTCCWQLNRGQVLRVNVFRGEDIALSLPLLYKYFLCHEWSRLSSLRDIAISVFFWVIDMNFSEIDERPIKKMPLLHLELFSWKNIEIEKSVKVPKAQPCATINPDTRRKTHFGIAHISLSNLRFSWFPLPGLECFRSENINYQIQATSLMPQRGMCYF